MSWEQIKQYVEEGGVAASAEVEQQFLRVAANGGKAGEAYLMQMMNNIDLSIVCLTKAVLLMAMSPFITYGVGAETVPQPKDLLREPSPGRSWNDQTLSLLEQLAKRELTGHAAQRAMLAEMEQLDDDSASLLYRVLTKEMRIGCGPKTVNKFHKGLVPVFEIKGAKRTKEALHKVSWPCYAEYKYDGFRCVIKTDGKTFETFSRNGLPMPNLEWRAEELCRLTAALIEAGVLAQRIWAWDGEGKAMGHFNRTSSEARKAGKGAELTYNIFDLLPWEHMAGGTETIEVRYARLAKVEEYLHEHATDYQMLRRAEVFELDEEADAWELYAQARELGHEGLILKQKGSFYTPGKTNDWVKVKPEETKDLLITGTFPGEKGSKYEGMMGGVIVDHAGVAVKVGSGFSDDQRKLPADEFLNVMAEIMFHEVTPDGSLREPRFKGLRKDKYPEDADGAGAAA